MRGGGGGVGKAKQTETCKAEDRRHTSHLRTPEAAEGFYLDQSLSLPSLLCPLLSGPAFPLSPPPPPLSPPHTSREVTGHFKDQFGRLHFLFLFWNFEEFFMPFHFLPQTNANHQLPFKHKIGTHSQPLYKPGM